MFLKRVGLFIGKAVRDLKAGYNVGRVQTRTYFEEVNKLKEKASSK